LRETTAVCGSAQAKEIYYIVEDLPLGELNRC
jgi:hypothetical protein